MLALVQPPSVIAEIRQSHFPQHQNCSKDFNKTMSPQSWQNHLPFLNYFNAV